MWRRGSSDDSVWFDFGDGFAVFHRPSGKTHLLNEASHRLLTVLLEEPRDLATIIAEFEPDSDIPSPDDYTERMSQMLWRLEQFGLIERARS